MAQSALEIANAALYKLGATIVTATDGSDTSKEGAVIAARLDVCKRALLRMTPWNFAIKRKIVTPPSSVTLTTPFVTFVSANTIRFNCGTHTFVGGDYITAASTGVTEANGVFEVASVVANTSITITAPGVSSISGTPAAGTIRLSPAFDYAYLYSLPSDCLRLISVNEEVSSERWRVEGRKLLADLDTSIDVRFVQDVTDYTLMDISFYECFATYLAWDICDHITGSAQKKRDLWTDLNGGDGKVGLLPRARFEDAVEDSLQTIEANDWVGSRFGAGSSVIFDPVTVEHSAV